MRISLRARHLLLKKTQQSFIICVLPTIYIWMRLCGLKEKEATVCEVMGDTLDPNLKKDIGYMLGLFLLLSGSHAVL